MDKENMSKVQKLTFSAAIMALYVVAVYLTQGFSFGAYQIRIATSLYALSYLFPFLVLPLGLANFISNTLFGGLGILDMAGGFLVGIATSGLVAGLRKLQWNRCLIALIIVLVPGLGVSTWLSYILEMPYPALALNLCIGQLAPGVCGVLLVKVLGRVLGLEQGEIFV